MGWGPLSVRALQKLVRNGSSTQVTLPRPLLIELGWLPGEAVIVEMLEDRTVHVRRPREADFAPLSQRMVVLEPPRTVLS